MAINPIHRFVFGIPLAATSYANLFATTALLSPVLPSIKQVSTWERQFLTFMMEQKPEVRNRLIQDRKLTPENEKLLGAAIEYFQQQFKAE